MSGPPLPPLRRPKASDTEDDLLQMQDQFLASERSPLAAACVRPKNRPKEAKLAAQPMKPTKTKKPAAAECGRFTIALETLNEELAQVVFGVQEKNTEFIQSKVDESGPPRFVFQRSTEPVVSNEDGFPTPMDLARYYKEPVQLKSMEGKSFFAQEFDRLKGKQSDDNQPSSSTENSTMELPTADNLSEENARRLTAMSEKQINDAREEILERFDPKLIEFLQKRGEKREMESNKMETMESAASLSTLKEKVSHYKKSRIAAASSADECVTSQEKQFADDTIKNLEIIDWNPDDEYARLATDAVQLDFATKCLRTMMPRQEQALLRLFDQFTNRLSDGSDQLSDLAASRNEDIKRLFLRKIVDQQTDREITSFTEGIRPLVDDAWMLQPIRKVLDRCHLNGEVTETDVDIVRLALLWTVLLFSERLSLFYACVTPIGCFCRLAEIFLIGSPVMSDGCVISCMDRLINGYLVPQAQKNRLAIALEKPVAGLDAFLPFYEDLLRRFEEYSYGDARWSQLLLMAGYMNANLSAAMAIRWQLWSSERQIVRQITIKAAQAQYLLDHIDAAIQADAQVQEEQNYEQFSQLLALQAAALRRGDVTRERNGLMFEIAARQLGHFVKRHTQDATEQHATARVKEFDALVSLLRNSLSGILNL